MNNTPNLLAMFATNSSKDHAGRTWELKLTHPNINSVFTGNDLIIGVGENGTIITSTDGVNWVTRSSGVIFSLRAGVFFNGTYIVVGDAGWTSSPVLTSTDGITWTPRSSGMSRVFHHSIASNGSRWVAVGNDGVISHGSTTSPFSYSYAQSESRTNLRGVTWTGSTFAAVDEFGAVITSTDGAVWSRNVLRSTTFKSNNTTARAIAVGDSGVIMSSPDGSSGWVFRNSGVTENLNKVVANSNTFVAVGSGGRIITSADGITWATRSSGTTIPLVDVATNGNLFVAVGQQNSVITSTDGITWTIRSISIGGEVFSPSAIVWNGSMFLMSARNAILKSTDGINWVRANPKLNGVATNGSIFVAVGDGGKILTTVANSSVPEKSWIVRNSGVTENLCGIVWNGSNFLAVGDKGRILSSTDGTNWTARFSGISTAWGTNHPQNDLKKVAWGNGRYMVVGEHAVITSVDGVTWATSANWTVSFKDVVYVPNQNMFVVVSNGSIHTSYNNGVSWSNEQINANVNALAFNPITNTLCVVGSSVFTGSPGWWNEEVIQYTGAEYKAVCAWGNGFRVFGCINHSNEGRVLLSDFPGSWNVINSGVGADFNSTVAFDYGLVVAVGNNGAIGTVTYNNFQLIGNPGFGNSSSQRMTFDSTKNTFFAVNRIAADIFNTVDGSVVYREGQGSGSQWMTNGNNWINSGIECSNGLLVVSTQSKDAYFTSTNGVLWERKSIGKNVRLHDVKYYNSRWVAVGDSYGVLANTSVNLTSEWSSHTLGVSYGVIHHNNKLISVSEGMNSTSDNFQWAPLNIIAPSGTFYSISKSSDIIVAVGKNGVIQTSGDGVTWVPRTSNTTNDLLSVTWTGTRFLAIGEGGHVLSSTDWTGIHWFTIKVGVGRINGVTAASSGMFAATCNKGLVITSTDGNTWIARTPVTSSNLNAITHNGSLFVGVGNGGVVVTSGDGVNWVARSVGQAVDLSCIATNGSLFVAGGTNGRVFTSTDGTSWTSRTSQTTNAFLGIAHNGSTFVIVGVQGVLNTSSDGINWVSRTSNTTSNINTITRRIGVSASSVGFVAAGEPHDGTFTPGNVITSTGTTGASWATTKTGSQNSMFGSASSSTLFVAVGSWGRISTSYTGTEWVNIQLTTNNLRAAAFNGRRFVVVGDHGSVITSNLV
jgi:hypothetical protein